ncbi:MAG: hypothetical protein K0R39_2887 [Symbiobacteriaceae bacterium]|jgi:hypothetical protein|nr:hypothetical protein [Symbiobacteriaceae bacterium]
MSELPNASQFWLDLHHATEAIGQGQPFTAHGRLEPCRAALVGIYRLALSPGAPGAGYEAAESLPGAAKVLDNLLEWLVVPLDPRAQWRCAHRLATNFEKLMLPLSERLHIDYPWAIRNLTFKQLDEIRPDRLTTAAEAPTVPRFADLANVPDAPQKTPGPARFKLKSRRLPE